MDGTEITANSNRHTIVIIARFEFFEHFRNKWLIVYGASFFVLANMIIYIGGANPLQASGSLLSLVLLLVPIFSLIFGSISFTETLPFMELMAAQPVSRRDIFLGKWLGLSLGLSLAFLLGMGGGAIVRLDGGGQGVATIVMLLGLGAMLSFVFVSISFLLANLSMRKEVVFGLALGGWFYFFILHDLILFGIIASFGDYPLEWVILLMSILNPIDLARVMITLQMDISALMGASGVVMKTFFLGGAGTLFGGFILLLWTALPLVAGAKLFSRRKL